jgi:hypothetical protein
LFDSFRVVVFEAKDRNKILTELSRNSAFKGAVFRSYTGTLYANELSIKHNNGSRILLCKELYMMFPVVFYLQKHSYLLNVINEKIEIIKAAGLSDYWHKIIIDERYLKIVESKQPKAIKMKYLVGTFNVLLMGAGVAVFVFVWELTKHYVLKIRNAKCLKTNSLFNSCSKKSRLP